MSDIVAGRRLTLDATLKITMRSIIVRSCLLEYLIQVREETFSNQW